MWLLKEVLIQGHEVMFSDLKMGAWKSQAPLKYEEDSFASHL